MEGIRRENQEKHGRRICIDTSVAIEIVKRSPRVASLPNSYPASVPVIAAITAFELLNRKTNLEKAEQFILNSDILNFDEAAARKAAEIAQQLSVRGKSTQFRDLFIAATAIVNNCELLTLNRKDFEQIEGLKIVELS